MRRTRIMLGIAAMALAQFAHADIGGKSSAEWDRQFLNAYATGGVEAEKAARQAYVDAYNAQHPTYAPSNNVYADGRPDPNAIVINNNDGFVVGGGSSSNVPRTPAPSNNVYVDVRPTQNTSPVRNNDGFVVGGGPVNKTPANDGFVVGGGPVNKAPVNDGFVAGPGGSVKYKTRTGSGGETIYTFE